MWYGIVWFGKNLVHLNIWRCNMAEHCMVWWKRRVGKIGCGKRKPSSTFWLRQISSFGSYFFLFAPFFMKTPPHFFIATCFSESKGALFELWKSATTLGVSYQDFVNKCVPCYEVADVGHLWLFKWIFLSRRTSSPLLDPLYLATAVFLVLGDQQMCCGAGSWKVYKWGHLDSWNLFVHLFDILCSPRSSVVGHCCCVSCLGDDGHRSTDQQLWWGCKSAKVQIKPRQTGCCWLRFT